MCKCLPNLLEYNGQCYSCPANSVVTPDQQGCSCISGYVLSDSYQCVFDSQGTVVQAASVGG